MGLNDQAEIQQAAREWLLMKYEQELYDLYEFGVDDPEFIAQANLLTDFHISQSEEERKRIQELEEWKKSVSSTIKTIPEFHSGQWGGDKEGWGFHFEVVNWLRRTKESAEAEVSRLRGALEQPTNAEVIKIIDLLREKDSIWGWNSGITVKPAIKHFLELRAALSSPPASAEREVKG